MDPQKAIETLEWGAYIDRTAAGEHDMYILGWITVTGDPDYGLYLVFHNILIYIMWNFLINKMR